MKGNHIIKQFNTEQLGEKELIVERLLKEGSISVKEAITLLKTISVEIKSLEMSSGAKIVGGSDFESNNI